MRRASNLDIIGGQPRGLLDGLGNSGISASSPPTMAITGVRGLPKTRESLAARKWSGLRGVLRNQIPGAA